MGPFDARVVRAAYDAVVDEYVAAFADDLASLSLDGAMLDHAMSLAPAGFAADLGCGPGQVAAYLSRRRPDVVAIDLSQAMLVAAARRVRGLAQGDIRALPLCDRSCGLAAAYYSIQHLPREDFPQALGEFRRVLCDGGVLLVATHLGEGEVLVDDFLGRRVEPMGGTMYGRSEVLDALVGAGFVVEVEQQRDALPHEYPSRRIYVVATRRPS